MMIQYTEAIPLIRKEQLITYKIGAMEIFRYDQTRMPFMKQELENCSGQLKISSLGFTGYGEYTVMNSHEYQDIVRWARVFIHLKGLTLWQAYDYVDNHRSCWGVVRAELAESALNNLVLQIGNLPITPSHERHERLYQRTMLIECSTAYYSF